MKRHLGWLAAVWIAAGCSAGAPANSASKDGGSLDGNTVTGSQGFAVRSAFLAHQDTGSAELPELGVYLADVSMTCDEFVQRTGHPGKLVHVYVGHDPLLGSVDAGTYAIHKDPQPAGQGMTAQLRLDTFPASGASVEFAGGSGTVTVGSITASQVAGSFEADIARDDGTDPSHLSGTFQASYCQGIGK